MIGTCRPTPLQGGVNGDLESAKTVSRHGFFGTLEESKENHVEKNRYGATLEKQKNIATPATLPNEYTAH